MSGRVPDVLVERLRLGELSPADAAAVRARLAEAGELERIATLDADDHATLARHPRLELPRRRSWPWVVPALVAVAAALLLFVRAPAPSEPWLRAKGDVHPALVVYRQTPAGYEVLSDGATAAPGDVLQLAYVAAGRQVGALVSLDGRGHTTVHVPVGVLRQGGEVRLPGAYRLDDAPTFERFVLMTFTPERGVELTTVTVRK